jgi:Glycosyl hydrolase family 115
VLVVDANDWRGVTRAAADLQADVRRVTDVTPELRTSLPSLAPAVVIAGSDKRGTIYGIYDLSEQIGVSPWYWWADVVPDRREALYVRRGRYLRGEPSVKYRGIFLNDEKPNLDYWVRKHYGERPVPGATSANFNSAFYARIFEVILRLKGNYLWPAMWNNAFAEDDPDNPRLADEYGGW